MGLSPPPVIDGNAARLRIEPGWKPGEPLPSSAHLGSRAKALGEVLESFVALR